MVMEKASFSLVSAERRIALSEQGRLFGIFGIVLPRLYISECDDIIAAARLETVFNRLYSSLEEEYLLAVRGIVPTRAGLFRPYVSFTPRVEDGRLFIERRLGGGFDAPPEPITDIFELSSGRLIV